MRVYLDTNIIITCSKDDDILQIKKIAGEKGIVFVFSQTARIEQKNRSLDCYSRDLKQAILNLKWTKDLISDEAAVKTAEDEYWRQSDRLEKFKKTEKDEWDSWGGYKFDIPRCTFEGLLTMAQAFTDFGRFDAKGEIRLLTILMEKFGLSGNDALHAMEAHSEGSDYFLSGDKRLISKLKKVEWLETKPVAPKELLDILREKYRSLRG